MTNEQNEPCKWKTTTTAKHLASIQSEVDWIDGFHKTVVINVASCATLRKAQILTGMDWKWLRRVVRAQSERQQFACSFVHFE